MTIYTEPPRWRSFPEDKPTLLVCWWITSFCAVVIALRVTGRFIRMERLFTEDRIAALALIPLFMRMGCVQYFLRYGTNNVDLTGITLSEAELRNRQIGSGLVLASRILYAATYVSHLSSPQSSGPLRHGIKHILSPQPFGCATPPFVFISFPTYLLSASSTSSPPSLIIHHSAPRHVRHTR
jgi:hypothetical protein